MNWLKLAPYIAGAAILGLLFWAYSYQIGEAEDRGYARAVAEQNAATLKAIADAQAEVERIKAQAKEADEHARQSKAAELAAVHADYAARPTGVIRVCLAAPESDRASVPGTAEAGGGSAAGASGAGALPTGSPQDTVAYFDPEPLFALFRDADKVVAECRAYIGRQESTLHGTN